MALTPNSSANPYCSPAQYQNFVDVRLTGQLVRDDGTIATASELLSDPVLAAHLAAASGEVEAAALYGGRYLPSDLQALNGVSAQWLAKLVANLAFGSMMQRRGYDLQKYPQVVDALAQLEKIRAGDVILAFAEIEQAGVAASRYRTLAEIESARLLTRSTAALRFMGQSIPGYSNGAPGWNSFE